MSEQTYTSSRPHVCPKAVILIHLARFCEWCSGEATASHGKSILWVFWLGSGPVFVVFCWFCCLLRLSAGETQVWLGDLQVVVLVGFLRLCVIYRFAWFTGHDCPLYKYLFCLCSCKDRAFSATSAILEEKKKRNVEEGFGATLKVPSNLWGPLKVPLKPSPRLPSKTLKVKEASKNSSKPA